MTAEQTLREIRSRGHYRVNFRPTAYRPTSLELRACRDLVEANKVSLRGWDYPHFPGDSDLSPGANYYEGSTNWSGYKECWRLYQSEQFVFLRGLREDWAAESPFQEPKHAPGAVLNVIGSLIYEVTELCELLARLRASGLYAEGAAIKVTLNGTRGRRAVIDDSRRMPLINEYRCAMESVTYSETLAAAAILPGNPDTAIRIIRFVLDRFGWHSPSSDLIDREVAQYLQRRASR